MDDGLLYENGKIRVTKNVFTNAQGDRFVIANIRSLRDERIGKPVFPLILGVACLGLAGFASFFPYSHYVMAGLGGLMIALYAMIKEKFVIYVTSPQGEVAALRTTSPDEFRDITRCLKKAISLHQQPVAAHVLAVD